MARPKTLIANLKAGTRWPKETVTPVSVPKVQVTSDEWNWAVEALEGHEQRMDNLNVLLLSDEIEDGDAAMATAGNGCIRALFFQTKPADGHRYAVTYLYHWGDDDFAISVDDVTEATGTVTNVTSDFRFKGDKLTDLEDGNGNVIGKIYASVSGYTSTIYQADMSALRMPYCCEVCFRYNQDKIIAELGQKIDEISNFSKTKERTSFGVFINASGKWASGASYIVDIDPTKITTVRVKGNSSHGSSGAFLTSKSYTIGSSPINLAGGATERLSWSVSESKSFDVPSDAKYFYYYAHSGYEPEVVEYLTSTKQAVEDLEQFSTTVDGILDDIFKTDVDATASSATGYISYEDGQVKTDINIYHSTFSVNPTKKYKANIFQGTNVDYKVAGVAYYDINGVFLGSEYNRDTSGVAKYYRGVILTVPSNAATCIVSGTPLTGSLPPQLFVVDYDNGDFAAQLSNLKTLIFEEKTFTPQWVCGAISANSLGSQVQFGTSESSALRYLHTRIYRVPPLSQIRVTGSNTNISLGIFFFNDNFTNLGRTAVRNAGDSWSAYSISVPSNATMAVLQGYCSDGNGGYLPSMDITVTMTTSASDIPLFYPRPLDSGYTHLAVKIVMSNVTSNGYEPSGELQSESTYYADHGVLALPSSYDPQGTPTRLIMFTHGHAVTYDQSSVRFNSDDIHPEYWLSEGYAIFDMDGSVTGTFSGNHDYEPAFVNAYESAYQWIVAHYNVRRDGVFSTGRSQGGGTQFALCKASTIPIIAAVPMVPVTYPLGYVSGQSITGTQRKALLKAYGVPESNLNAVTWTAAATPFHNLTSAERELIETNQWRIAPYSPGYIYNRPLTDNELCEWSRGYATKDVSHFEAFFESVKDSIDVGAYKRAPMRLYTCVGDPTIWYQSVILLHRLMASAGMKVEIHVFPTTQDKTVVNTDHRFEINPENLVDYDNSKGVTIADVPKVYIEALAFWRRWENQDAIV